MRATPRRTSYAPMYAFLWAGLMGCSSDAPRGASGDTGGCVPGATAACACAGAQAGVQECGDDGRFGACVCEDPRAPRGDASGAGGSGDAPAEPSEEDAGAGGAREAECVALPSNFTQDTTLEPGCYSVLATPSFAEYATLTLSPGVTILFAEDAGLTFSRTQALFAEGTKAKPIVLTSASKKRGSWRGLTFEQSKAESRLRYVTVEYAGRQDTSAASSWNLPANVAIQQSSVAIDDCTIRESAGYGVQFDYAAPKSFEGNAIHANAWNPVRIGPTDAHRLSPSTAYTGNGRDGIALSGGGDLSPLTDVDLPFYVAPGERVSLRSMAPGTTLVMGKDASIACVFGCELSGTKQSPILITAEEPTPGYWRGVILDMLSTSLIEHVTIEYGGAGRFGGNIVLPTSPDQHRLTVKNSVLKHSAGYGIYVDPDRRQFVNADFRSANTFEDNALGDANVEGVPPAGAAGSGAGGNSGRGGSGSAGAPASPAAGSASTPSGSGGSGAGGSFGNPAGSAGR